ncbi:MAG: phosphocholine cytidylyltransferase family protein [Lactobacillales bacterium]|jgi:choline kinase|nr:phosphocholine cytidylyltransferase family protein [Lactobacillales bacterium]
MKAIILAAGQGTRLKKYTKDLPKGMLEFNSKTLIEWQIERYRECGINDIIIIKGFCEEKITYNGVKYFVNKNFLTTNMVESLMTAKSEFDTDIIVSYSDLWFEKRILEKLVEASDDFVVSVDVDWQNYWKKRYGLVQYDLESLKIEKANIVKLGESNPIFEDIDARYIGLLKISKKGLDIICSIIDRDSKEYSDKPWKYSGNIISQAYMTDLFQAIVDEGYVVKAKKFKKGWLEFDTNKDYENICKWVKNGEIKELVDLDSLQ